ncbi:oxidoreductase-like protein [Xylaria digitata]|nr:oxidoreductase-like protein [Xylaria digitata]
MPPNMRPLMRVARLQSTVSRNSRAFASLPGGTPRESSEQAMPIGPYYEAILRKPQPIPAVKPEEPPTSSPKSRSTSKRATAAQKSKAGGEPSSSSGTTTSTTPSTTTIASTTTVPPQPSAEPATAQEKARIIFGSPLAGPAERADRLQSIRDRSTLIAGVLVPPRPEEPDNCCMSGCVNCVWDRYGEELEEWAAASTRAEEALQSEQVQGPVVMEDANAVPAPSSLGSDMNRQTEEMAKTGRPKIAKDLWDDDLYSNVPVGIREFMKIEKKLKKKHREEGTFGA